MRYLQLLILLCLVSCGGETTNPPPAQEAPRVTAPAPGTAPQNAVSGDLPFTLLGLGDFRSVEGCTVLLRPEGTDAERYVYGFNYAEGPAEGIFEKDFQTLEVEREETDGNTSTYVHTNDAYEVTTTLNREIQVDNELWEVSGTVTVRNRQTGKTVRVRVLGEQGC